MKLSRDELDNAIDRAIKQWTAGIDDENDAAEAMPTKYKPLHQFIREEIEKAEKTKGG